MRKLKLGVAGLGRLGTEHAKNIQMRIPNTELLAVCNRSKEKLDRFVETYDVPYAFTDIDDFLKLQEMDAVVIATNTDSHAQLIEKSLQAGKHVFCEKPLSASLSECGRAVKAVREHPDLCCMLGFMRRFDPSYRRAKEKIDRGDIGKVISVRCASQDPLAIIDGFLEYAPRSGGIFFDLAIHDIDLIRFFTGSEPETLFAVGDCYAYPQLKELQDGDNVSCLIQNRDGSMASIFAGRAAAHGTVAETEIIGTKGSIRIASVPSDSLLEVMNTNGVVRECYQDFLTRWEEAYRYEIEYFASCVLSGNFSGPTVQDGKNAVQIAKMLQESFTDGKLKTV